MAKKTFTEFLLEHQLQSFLLQLTLTLNSCLFSCHVVTRLLQCALHEVVLEDHLEASTVLECSNMSSNGHASECPYDSSTP